MRLPFNGRNKITSIYGYRNINGVKNFHKGWDIVGLDDKTIYSPCDATVGNSTIITDKTNNTWQWGNYVRLDCENGDRIFFCHMSKRLVKRGDIVKEGTPIGVMGNTGYSFGEHLHMEFRKSPYQSSNSFSPEDRFNNISNSKGIYYNIVDIKDEVTKDPMIGIDVSRYQARIDWDAVKRAGIKFAILRSGYGKYEEQKDPYFDYNYQEAKRVGIPVGAYWYSYATNSADAVKEANVFLKVIRGKRFEFPLYFDQEDKKLSNIDPKVKVAIAEAFCNTLEEHKCFAGYYTYTSFAKTIDYEKLASRYTCWLADYRTNYNKTLTRDIHQYTQNGSVNGINGRVDMNRCTRDFESIIKKAGLNGYDKIEENKPVNKPNDAQKPNMIKLENKRLRIDGKNCEFFKTYSVEHPVGYLPQNATYVCYAKSQNMVNGFRWATIGYQGKEMWVALVEDNRAVIIDKPEIEQFNMGDKVKLYGRLYANSTTPAGKPKDSCYWIYDGMKFNGRYRVTSAHFRCGQKPGNMNISGYADEKDMTKV